MIRALLFYLAYIIFLSSAEAQYSFRNPVMIIDSVPLYQKPSKTNTFTNEDIADISVIRDKDSLNQLGWPALDSISFIFTKEYRKRPDSLKKIPSLKQMVYKNNVWYLKDTIYSGRYINYYNNGRKQNEGILVNGKVDGKLTNYFQTGVVKSVWEIEQGIMHGVMREYHKNGSLRQQRIMSYGKYTGKEVLYYYNGQKVWEGRGKKETPYDSIVTYFSTGNIRDIKLLKKNKAIQSKREKKVSEYTDRFLTALEQLDFKVANKNFYKIWLLDSTSVYTYYKESLLLAAEYRFRESINQLDKVLEMEPLLMDALLRRAIARMKLHHPEFQKENVSNPNLFLTVDVFKFIPEAEIELICKDILLAEELDSQDNVINRIIPEKMLAYCREKQRTGYVQTK